MERGRRPNHGVKLMATDQRFTAWLSVAERNKLRSMAAEYGTSENYVLRMALRRAFGMPTPTYAESNTADKAEQM